MSKKIIPFSLYPYSWGLTGKARERARAEYELSGFELDSRLLDLSRDELDEETYNRKNWELQLKCGLISKADFDKNLISLIKDERERQIALLDLQKQEGSITELEYAKSSATLKGEPWVTVLSMDFGGKKSLEGSFELDWNEIFVESLKKEGYEGLTADSIVNQWFMEVCRNVALEEFDGTGNFSADSEANLETVKRWNSESIGNNRKGHS
jgi:hypothetical protein